MTQINHSLHEDYTGKKSMVILFCLMTKREIKCLKIIPLPVFQQSPSANTLEEKDCLSHNEKHLESSASSVETILSAGF